MPGIESQSPQPSREPRVSYTQLLAVYRMESAITDKDEQAALGEESEATSTEEQATSMDPEKAVELARVAGRREVLDALSAFMVRHI
jgi:hypothetical protein